MTQEHYSLRWNNHQSHILAAFEALLQAENLVDVTLVCAEASVRAHKVVLSACSPFFQRIFSENPCKHPVIVLKDFSGWEVQAIVDFMYKGEISVGQEQLQSLIKAAESLQVRGLATQDPLFGDKDSSSILNQTPTPSTSPTEFERGFFAPGEFVYAKPPHMSRLAFPDECHSPLLPRRKQARPRRRSGELSAPQDLSRPPAPTPPAEPVPEDLCMKRAASPPPLDEARASPERGAASPEPEAMKREAESRSPLAFATMPSVSALAMTPPHSKFFGLDSPLGLFPPGLDGCRNSLFDLPDPRSTSDSQLFVKKKMGRPKGQHSAPRGGPPRSWTNAELTEALQHVWNKKMTTSQASRIFGIPYNSLLMYVRGKYGKSLKLEQLRKDCIGGPPPPPLDLLALNNNNHHKDGERPASAGEHAPAPPPVFNPFGPHAFYPDFGGGGGGFPIPVSMIHLLPQSEKNMAAYGLGVGAGGDDAGVKKELEMEEDLYRGGAPSVDDRRELLNGQD